jgi:pyruvate dehydrogenase E1 component alpha subunit
VYVLQNNQIALGTRLDQHQAGPFTAWSKAYGITAFSCDGNNVLDTYAATKLAADLARNGSGPAIVTAETFRMGGHATHDEAEAREICGAELFEYWGKRDPIGTYESWLEAQGVSKTTLDETEQKVIAELAQAEKEALASREKSMPKPETAIAGVYAETAAAPAGKWSEPESPKAGSTRKTPSR